MSLRAAFETQARHCAALDSPFMARLMTLCAERLRPGGQVADRLFAWPGDTSAAGDSVPLRLAGALHRLVLSGRAHGLAAVYPPQEAGDEALWAAVTEVLAQEAAAIDAMLDSPPQTNEVRRAACLIATGHALEARFGLPLRLSELGASAGLNLMWDRFALEAGEMRLGPAAPLLTLRPEWRGEAPEMGAPQVIERRGVDLAPIDARDPADAERLLGYLWPDQPERLERTRAALAGFTAEVAAGDALDWLPARLSERQEGTLHLIYHTVAWQYLPEAARARGEALIEQAGAEARPEAPLARLSMETDGRPEGAALRLQVWPGGEAHDLGRIDFHGRWVDWRRPVWPR
ncbi:DUF2332 domain-containing protein [Roseivivax sp.]